MTPYSELNDIALALLQVTALLLPVIFLTMNFVKSEGLNEFSDQTQDRLAKNFIYMIALLTGTGLFGTVGLLRTPVKRLLLVVAVILLSGFFLIYGLFIYLIMYGE